MFCHVFVFVGYLTVCIIRLCAAQFVVCGARCVNVVSRRILSEEARNG